MVNGRHELPIPFKEVDSILKAHLKRDKVLKRQYAEMDELFWEGYSEQVKGEGPPRKTVPLSIRPPPSTEKYV